MEIRKIIVVIWTLLFVFLLAETASAQNISFMQAIYVNDENITLPVFVPFFSEDAAQQEADLIYSVSYGYDGLGEAPRGAAKQILYRKIDEEAKKFHYNTSINAPDNIFPNAPDVNVVAGIPYEYGLSKDDLMEVMLMYKHDHPLYYWIDTIFWYSNSNFYLVTTNEYAQGTDREVYNRLISGKLGEYRKMIAGETSAYRIALAYHDAIIEVVDYVYEVDGITPQDDLWAHNILGVLAERGAVCESYARTFQLLLNAAGVENRIVTGVSGSENHAWNLVQLDDGEWYWCDLTWDDDPDWMWGVKYNYFCVNDRESVSWLDGNYTVIGNANFLTKHIYDTPDRTGTYYLYSLPARSSTTFQSTDGTLCLRDTFEVGNIKYAVVGYNAVQIVELTNNSEELVLPETVTYNDVTYSVISIGGIGSNGLLEAGPPIWRGSVPTSVKIPKSMRFIWDDSFYMPKIEEFIVDRQNSWLTSRDGVLFTKSLYTLILYPRASERTEYTIPEETYEIAHHAFRETEHLETLTIGSNVRLLGRSNGGVGYCEDSSSSRDGVIVKDQWNELFHALVGKQQLIIAPNNSIFKQIDGVIYSGNYTVLEYVFDKSIETLMVPDGVQTLLEFSVRQCNSLKTVVLPASVTCLENHVFFYLNNLSDVYFLGDVPEVWKDPFSGSEKLLTLHYNAEKSGWSTPKWTASTGTTYFTVPIVWEENGDLHIHSIKSVESSGVGHTMNCACGYVSREFKHTNIVGDDNLCDICGGVCQYCGTNAIWTYNDGVLTISGTGATENYYRASQMPWYEYRLQIKRIVVEEGITAIGSCSFSNFDYVTEVSLPETLKTIGEYAFNYCYNLKTVVLPASVTSLKQYVFYHVDDLSDVYFLGDVPEVWGNPFLQSDKSLTLHCNTENTGWSVPEWTDIAGKTYVTSPLMWEENGDLHIHSCEKYEYSSAGHSMRCACDYISRAIEHRDAAGDNFCDICGCCCQYCGSHAVWELKDGVLTISGSGEMFDFSSASGFAPPWYTYKDEITYVVIEEGITKIGGGAFMQCENITKISLPDTLQIIGGAAFYECSKIEEVYIPASVESIESIAFAEASALRDVYFCGNVPVTWGADLFFRVSPRLILYYSDAAAGWSTPEWAHPSDPTEFYSTRQVSDEVLNSGHSCGENAVWAYEDGVLTIQGTGEIWSYFYSNVPWNDHRDEIRKVVIAEGITKLSRNLFSDHFTDYYSKDLPNLEQVMLPDTLTEIESDCFYKTKLKSIVIPASVKSIGSTALYSPSLRCVFFEGDAPETWSSSSLAAVSTSTGIGYLESADGWTTPEWSHPSRPEIYEAYPYDPEIVFSDSVCGYESEYSYENGVLTIRGEGKIWNNFGDIFEEDTGESRRSVTEIIIEDGITIIGDSAFREFYSAEKIRLSETLEVIGVYAFAASNAESSVLAEIIIPASLHTIKTYAFSNAIHLKRMYFKGSPPVLEGYIFGVRAECTLYYLENTPGWTLPKWEYGGYIYSTDIFGWQTDPVSGQQVPIPHNKHLYTYVADELYHHEECRCGDIQNRKEHMDEDFNCICDVCDWQYTHIYVRASDDDMHWMECERCGDSKDRYAHSNSNYYTDDLCDVCDHEVPHQHYYEFNYDGITHWYECTRCEDIQGYGEHCDENQDYYCDVCDRFFHKHCYTYTIDAEKHWQRCWCGEWGEKGEHLDEDHNDICDVCEYELPHRHYCHYDQYISDAERHWKECWCGDIWLSGSHLDMDWNGYCDVCNFSMPHTHEYTLNKDDSVHWEECCCRDIQNREEHMDEDFNCICDVCDWQYTHIYVRASDDDMHWMECERCGDSKDRYAHSNSNYDADDLCDVCDHEVPHQHSYRFNYNTITAHWYECNLCGDIQNYEEHCDENQDYYCDVCDMWFVHKHCFTYINDTEKHWQRCWCGEWGESRAKHLDEDHNDICDVCEYKLPHRHYYQYVSDAERHWDECWCGDIWLSGFHLDMDWNGYCDVCNFSMPHTHEYTLNKDDSVHWEECCCGDIQNRGEHTDEDLDDHCDVCEYHMSHKYANNNWLTDELYHWKSCVCGEISEKDQHIDRTFDDLCDTCGHQLPHVHSVWGKHSDELKHWETCRCGEIFNEASHTDNNMDDHCDVCGYYYHIHNYNWYSDEYKHWQSCRCGIVTENKSHTDTDTNNSCDICNHKDPHIHDISNSEWIYTENSYKHWKACECGYILISEEHTYGNWQTNENQHLKVCFCGSITEEAAHSDANNDELCDICGYQLPHTHTYSEWQCNATYHWKACICGSVINEAAHTDTDSDELCDICDYQFAHQYTYEADAIAHWGICACGEVNVKVIHTDSDSNGLCDICGHTVLTDMTFGINADGTYTLISVNKELQDIIIPESVTAIGDNAFSNCNNLKNLVIPEGVKEIGIYAFYNCISLETVRLPNTLTTIGNSAFWFCSSLKNISIPASVTTLENGAFWSCSALTDVYFFGDVPTVWAHVFDNIQPDKITIHYPADNKSGWTTTTWTAPDGVTYHTKPFEWITNPETGEAIPMLCGDVNIDGAVTQKDLELLVRYFAGYEVKIMAINATAIDGDDVLTRRDVMILARYLAGWNGYTLPYKSDLSQ